MSVDAAGILARCVEIAQEAGKIVADAWDKPRRISHKGPIDLVTATDVEVEKHLKSRLFELLPEAVFVGEESAGQSHKQLPGLCWIVDPVDGTTNFIHRLPHVGVSIGLFENGEPVLGVICAPMLGECYFGAKNHGAFLNGAPISVSQTDRLIDALIGGGIGYDVAFGMEEILARMGRVLGATQGERRLGSASLNLAYLASGRFDAFYEAGLKPWDVAAGWLLVTEAGGKVSDFEGSPYVMNRPMLASNGLLHPACVKLIHG